MTSEPSALSAKQFYSDNFGDICMKFPDVFEFAEMYARERLQDTERERDHLKIELEDELRADTQIQQIMEKQQDDLTAAQAELRTMTERLQIAQADISTLLSCDSQRLHPEVLRRIKEEQTRADQLLRTQGGECEPKV